MTEEDVKRLQEELATLKAENEQLQEEKRELEDLIEREARKVREHIWRDLMRDGFVPGGAPR